LSPPELNDSQSWWEAEQTLESVEPKLGKIRLRTWDNLHFRGSPKVSVQQIGGAIILVAKTSPRDEEKIFRE
jgi:hypothetical protein